MTVSVQSPITKYIGNGTTTSFPYTFRILQEDDLHVYVDKIQQGSGFYIEDIGNQSGGNVVFYTAPNDGVEISLERHVNIERQTDYLNGGSLDAETLDDDFDRIWMAIQDLDVYAAGSLVTSYINKIETYTASDGQTAFNTTNPISVGMNSIRVHVNGVYQIPGVAYAETTSTRITFTEPLESGDNVTIEFQIARKLDTVDADNALLSDVNNYYESENVEGALREVGIYMNSNIDVSKVAGLATVATTGSYGDLINKPSIPSSIDNLSDVSLSSAATNDLLKFDGTNWVDASSLLHVQFDTSNIIASNSTGKLVYNNDIGGLEVLMKGGNVNLQIGQEQLVRIHNNTGSPLTDGQVVYITGSTGQFPTVSLAANTSELTSSKTIGVVTETISNGSDGFITISGLVNGLNTNSFNAGDALWLSSTAGQFTTTKPSAPNHTVFVGWVVKKSAGNGSIFVNIQNGWEIAELHDVLINSPTNNQLLKYNSTSGVWENWTPNYITTLSLDGISDVSLSGAVSGQVLKYDGTNWVNDSAAAGIAALDDLTDVSIATAVSGQILKYNGTQWVNDTVSSGVTSINDLSDVSLSSATTGDLLRFDGSQWSDWAPNYSTTIQLNAEISRAQAAETSLSSAINLEYTRAIGAEATLQSNITIETSRAQAAEASLSSAIIAETSRAQSAEASLSSAIPTVLDNLSDVSLASSTTGQVLKYNGTQWVNDTITTTVTPAGNNTEIQYNNSGSLGASSDLKWDNTNKVLTIGGQWVEAHLGSQSIAGNPVLAFHSSGNATSDANIYADVGSGSNDGDLYFQCGNEFHYSNVVYLRTGAQDIFAQVRAPAGQDRYLRFTSATSDRWHVGVSNESESGSNTGSNFYIKSYDDGGVLLTTPLSINRSTGVVTVSSISGNGSALTSLNASNLSSGTVDTARLGTGTADSTTYLAGDSTWKTTPTSILNLGITEGTADQVLKTDGAGSQSFTSLKTINGTSVIGAGNIVVTSGSGLGNITAYKADGSQDNIDVNANTSLTQVGITQELLMDASALVAIETTSSYGWRDNIAPFVVKATSGTNNPSWSALWSGMEGLTFSASAMNQVWVDFHIDHDYALGTSLYPHIHWVPTTTGTGTVRWGIEYSVAKGHQQGASSIFPASTTVYVEQTIASNSQWMHFVAEVSDVNAIPATNVEPDSVIKCRIFRDAAHPNDTYTGTVHAWQSDLHYRSNRFATLNKAPSFNG